MREVQNGLRQIRGLDDAAHFDGAFVFDEFADEVEEVGGELFGLRWLIYSHYLWEECIDILVEMRWIEVEK